MIFRRKFKSDFLTKKKNHFMKINSDLIFIMKENVIFIRKI